MKINRLGLLLLALATTNVVALLVGCADKADSQPGDTAASKEATPGNPSDLSALSLKDLFDRVQQANARERQLMADMHTDIDQTKARLGQDARGPAGVAEEKRIRETWPPQLQAAAAERELIQQEIRRRCPGGASLNAVEQHCSQ